VISKTIGEALRIGVRASPILSFRFGAGSAIHIPPIGEGQQIYKKKSAKISYWRYEFALLRL
jgi:hypothetical protein